MKKMSTQHSVEEVRTVITECLKKAALVNYTRITEFAKIEGESCLLSSPLGGNLYAAIVMFVLSLHGIQANYFSLY